MPGTVLIVDDDHEFCAMVEADLRRHGLDAESRTSAAEAFELVTATDTIDVVLVDLVMPGLDGLALCRRLVRNREDVQLIAVTGFGSMEKAVDALRAGVHDFVTKPIDLAALRARVEEALQQRALQRELRAVHAAADPDEGFAELVGRSAGMRRLFDQLSRAAASDATVLVTGESGTGKELVARALHERGGRRTGPFVAVNCPALPEALLESELFGHTRGAYTDARAASPGMLLEAHGGTVFLDEVGDLPLALQPKLLRALEERVVRPVGGGRERGFDARVVAATNRDLERAVADGRFREDLWFRLNVIQLQVPPLREREGDVLLLAEHFVRRIAGRTGKQVQGLTDGVARRLRDYDWPGNVRELRNAMERAVALTRFERIIVEDLPERLRAYTATGAPAADDPADDLLPLEEVERRHVLRVLAAVDGNKAEAARVLGVDRKTLYRKLERWERDGSA